MTLRCYEDYTVWQKAMDLAEAVYAVTLKLPFEERFGLSSCVGQQFRFLQILRKDKLGEQIKSFLTSCISPKALLLKSKRN